MNVAKFLHEGCLVWTLTTNGYKFFTLNLYTSLKKIGVPWKLCIVCADKPCYKYFSNEGIPCILYDKPQSDSIAKPFLFETKLFQEINLVKLDCLTTFANTPTIETCVYIDGDIFIQKDILADLRPRLETTPLLFQCDEHGTSCTKPCTNVCTGVIAWKKGHDNGVFFVHDKPKWKEMPEDQRWVNWKLRENNLTYDTLPRDLYPNGTYSNTWRETAPNFALLHYNWIVGNAKMTRMKKNSHWLIPYS